MQTRTPTFSLLGCAFGTLFAARLTGCHTVDDAARPAQRPNVVLIMTDDQGLGDFGFAGNPVLETPHLDALYAECPRVERFYVSPVCSPTRASLMTGRYNYRTRVVDTWRGRSMMDTDEVTLAEVLRDAGYRTGIFGKWHLGDAHPLRPVDQGFGESLVHRGGGIAQPSEPVRNRRRYTNPVLVRNGREVDTSGYCTDVYFDAALEFVDASLDADEPFFCYLPTNAPHGPFHDVPQDLYEKYSALDMGLVQEGEKHRDRLARTFAMIENIDRNIGRLLARLDARDAARDTIVVFLNDNGPVAGRYVCGLRAGKGSVYEGGIRSPLLVRWPGRLAPSTEVDAAGMHIDLFPTLLDLTGIPAPSGVRVDGRSLRAALEGSLSADTKERLLFVQSHRGDAPTLEHHFAVIGPRWKLVRASGFGRLLPGDDAPFELFDLALDPGETTDVAADHPEVVARMRTEYAAWFADVGATRPDNYAPPRLVPCTSAEPITTLTRQDFRPYAPTGWGEDGVWPLHLDYRAALDVTLHFREFRAIEQVVLHFNGRSDRALTPIETIAGDGDDPFVVRLPRAHFPAGDVDLRIECRNAGESFAPYQAILSGP